MGDPGPPPLWRVTAAEPEEADGFVSGAKVDVGVVGAGYTGLSTALHCAAGGLDVQVIEADGIGAGGSGRNAGLVNASVWMAPDAVRRALGETYGPRFLRRFSDGPAYVFDLIEKHQIRCEVTRSGTLHAAHAASGLADLRRRHAAWQRLGEPVELLGAEDMARKVGSEAFSGGLHDHRAGTVNPMGYARGLARVARAAGARVSTGIRASKLTRRAEGGWRIDTAAGPVLAGQVVLATNAYTDALWPGLGKVFSTIDYLQVATEPLRQAGAHILPGGEGLWDTAPIMFSCRRDAAGRLILGTMGRVFGTAAQGVTRRWAATRLQRLFPGLGPVRFEAAWSGRIAMTPDHLPRVHRLAEGLWTPIGYNGRGIATGTLFGQAMADLLTGTDPRELPLPLTDMAAAPRRALTSRFHDLAFAANQLWGGVR
ncbi:MAG: FAD-binding oxidoreductase [Paracoccaceae bacterium]|nr:FAD-binding oxidoreductase [Paracoccaceae bacterium]